jgi:hypothetical protein
LYRTASSAHASSIGWIVSPSLPRGSKAGSHSSHKNYWNFSVDFEPELNRQSGPMAGLRPCRSEFGVAGQVSLGRRRRRGTNPFNEAKALDTARDEQILQKVISIEVNVWPDLVGRKIPGLIRQMDPDIPTDLADPDAPVTDSKWREPKPEMIALTNGMADLL